MTLNDVMKETADAIREKKGTTGLIAPVNFAEEIKGITAGGGESGGSAQGSKWLYFDTTNVADGGTLAMLISNYATYLKMRTVEGDWRYIGPAGIIGSLGDEVINRLLAIGIDMSTKQYGPLTNNRLMSFEEMEAANGQSFAEVLQQMGFVEITKEEFYTFE